MDQTLSRLTNPFILLWLATALTGIVVSVGSLLIMRYEIARHPAALRVPMISAMKRHDIIAELVRLGTQLLAIAIVVVVVIGIENMTFVAIGLIVMNASLVINSLFELVTTLRMIGPSAAHLERRPSKSYFE